MKLAAAALVYNPRAGRVLRSPASFHKAVEILRRTWPELQLMATTGPKSAGGIARSAADAGLSPVIVCGGDGTLNEVVQSLSGTEVHVGVLPGGTANVLANEILLGNDMIAAARELIEAEPVDVATAELRRGDEVTRFILMAGIGFDARVVFDLDLANKDRWGKGAYWSAAIRQIGRGLETFDVTVEGTTVRCSFALASRVRNYGGDVSIARGASLLEDQFEVVLFETTSVMRLAWLFVGGVIAGRLHKKRDVRIMKTRCLSMTNADGNVHVQVDGEYAGLIPVEIVISSDPIRMLLPRGWLRKERARLGSR